MSNHLSDGQMGYAIFNASTGQLIATDDVFQQWMGEGSLSTLLPDFDMKRLANAPELSEHTRIYPFEDEAKSAKFKITPLSGPNQNWVLIHIECSLPLSSASEYRDIVTNLPDRRALEPHRRQWQQESPSGHMPHALLFLDLDNFKQINDQFGHATGDMVLNVLAGRWQESLRAQDLIVRYGGDEFVVLLAGVRSSQDAQPIVDRLARVTASPIDVNGRSVEVSVAIGIAMATNVEVSLDDLLSTADKAMYAGKRRI